MIVSLFDWECKKFLKFSSYYIDSYDYSKNLPKVELTIYHNKQTAGNTIKALSLLNIYDTNRMQVRKFSINNYHGTSRYIFKNFVVKIEEFLYNYLIILNAIFLHKEIENNRIIHEGLFIENRKDVFPILKPSSLFNILSYTYSIRMIAHKNLHIIAKYL